MKVITIAGTATKDGEVKEGGMDKAGLGSFSLAVDDGYGANKSTMYFDCTFWGKRGIAVVPYVRKGSKVTVSGELTRREYNSKTCPTTVYVGCAYPKQLIIAAPKMPPP